MKLCALPSLAAALAVGMLPLTTSSFAQGIPAPPAALQKTPGIVPSGRKSDPPAFDLTGVWWVTQPEGAAGFKPDPPLKPAAKAVVDEVARLRASGLNARDKTGNCAPAGMPLIMTRVYPIQIFQTPKLITIIYEYHNAVRWIWMDGRDHPKGEDLIPTYYGHSVGWWEGGALMVDTVGMLTEPDIQPGVPHTENLHILERISLTADGFVTQLTLTDPSIFERPWVTQKTYQKSDAEIAEYVCLQDNNHFTTDDKGILRRVETGSK
jgi:hypothetical protein